MNLKVVIACLCLFSSFTTTSDIKILFLELWFFKWIQKFIFILISMDLGEVPQKFYSKIIDHITSNPEKKEELKSTFVVILYQHISNLIESKKSYQEIISVLTTSQTIYPADPDILNILGATLNRWVDFHVVLGIYIFFLYGRVGNYQIFYRFFCTFLLFVFCGLLATEMPMNLGIPRLK